MHNDLLASGRGACNRLESLTPHGDQDSFGNLECKPSAAAPGRSFYGSGLQDEIRKFITAQDVNHALSNNINTSWLAVGHVDEVVSFCPDGQHTIVADTEVCWALLLWAMTVESSALMHPEMNENGQTASLSTRS